MSVALLVWWKLLLRHPAGSAVAHLWPWATPAFVAVAAVSVLFTVVLLALDRTLGRDR